MNVGQHHLEIISVNDLPQIYVHRFPDYIWLDRNRQFYIFYYDQQECFVRRDHDV